MNILEDNPTLETVIEKADAFAYSLRQLVLLGNTVKVIDVNVCAYFSRRDKTRYTFEDPLLSIPRLGEEDTESTVFRIELTRGPRNFRFELVYQPSGAYSLAFGDGNSGSLFTSTILHLGESFNWSTIYGEDNHSTHFHIGNGDEERVRAGLAAGIATMPVTSVVDVSPADALWCLDHFVNKIVDIDAVENSIEKSVGKLAYERAVRNRNRGMH